MLLWEWNHFSCSAAQWLKKLEIDISPKKLLEYVGMRLMDEAADWADTYFDASRFLREQEPTIQSAVAFTNLLQQRFQADLWALSLFVDSASLFSPPFMQPAPFIQPAPLVQPHAYSAFFARDIY